MLSENTITPRDVRCKIAKNHPKYWFNGSAVKTLHANTLTASIPYGELFYVGSIVPLIPKIKDRKLKVRALNFVKQELNHSKEHYRFFLKMVRAHYPKLKVRNYLYQNLFILLYIIVGKRIRLATVAAMEHFTAEASDLYLRHPEFLTGLDPQLALLWQWHFIEEIEHKSVTYDIFLAIGGNYFHRLFGFVFSVFFLGTEFISYYVHMARYDKLHRSKQFYIDSYHLFWGKQGMIRQLILPYLRFLLPFFHPDKYGQAEQQALIKRELEKINTQLNEKIYQPSNA